MMDTAIRPFYLDLTEEEIKNIQEELGRILRGGTLILGDHTKAFEDEFAEYIGCKDAVALNTGTTALDILMRWHDVKGKRVAVASNTNFATVAAILHAGGQPVFMDMTEEYFVPNLDILRYTHEKYEVQGVAWVHIGGIIAPDFQEVVEYCRGHGLFLIEDAAHAHGSIMNGIKAGNFADGGAFSFFPTKVMTTMEGGMLTTNDEELAAYARSMRNQGKRGAAYGGLHYDLGNSWRISEIAAYIGRVQLLKLDAMVARRTQAAGGLAEELDRLAVEYCSTRHMDQASNYKFIVKLPEGCDRDKIKACLKDKGVICGGGVYDVPCHQQPVFQNIPYEEEDLKVTERWCPRHICPPITSGVTEEQVRYMRKAFAEVLNAR
ncbi:DegT/DnrJ/EryC1/StrS aminotransferase family protein [Candidatus Parcubacteria bacterium]|nr:MAG: DegT/DnrJ/EryC1/StrS aminotransferase family protein [Candidatus Parcubacteria bacterium]